MSPGRDKNLRSLNPQTEFSGFSMDMSKYREMFLSETKDHLQNMSRQALILEKDPSDRAGIDSLFREAHSIKGMAASMGYERTADLAHHLEDLMDGFRKTGTVPAAVVDRLLAGIDLLEGLMEDLAANRAERDISGFLLETPVPPEEPKLESPVKGETHPGAAPPSAGLAMVVKLAAQAPAPAARLLLVIRELSGLGPIFSCQPTEEELRQGGDFRRLDIRVDTLVPPERVKEILAGMPDVESVTFPGKPGKEPGISFRKEDATRTVRVRTELLDRLISLTGELITNRNMLQTASREERWQNVNEGLDQLSRLISDLHHQVLQVRMVPLGSITERLPRLVRDLCRKTGKDVKLRLEGEEVRLDRTILEELADPLVHLVRNAVDHGIEKTGEVAVRAWREKDMVLLEIADNGRGIDSEAVRRKAVEKGLLSPSLARTLEPRDLLQMICYPGFSTAARITQTSGRGVGMDVVKSAVENLGGTLEIFSATGQGTRFLLKLPLSVAIIQILLVECSGHTLGIPITRVLRNLEITRREVRSSGRRLVVALPRKSEKTDEEAASEEEEVEEVPLLSLRKILGLPGGSPSESISIVVTESRGRKFGLVVDRLAGHHQAFIKTLAFPLDRLAGVSGATILGDGSVVFIIDPQPLLEERLTAPGRPSGGKP